MEIVIQPTEKRRFMVVQNETINGLLFNFQTDFPSNQLVRMLEDFDLRIVEQLDNKEVHTVFDGTLQEAFAITYANNAPLATKTFLEPRDLGAGVIYQMPFSFGTNYNLKDGNSLFVECTNRKLKTVAGVEHDNILTIETVPSIGLKEFIPVFETRQLESTLEKHELNLDSSVHQIIYLPENAQSGDFDIKRVAYFSDKLKEELSATLLYSQLNNSVEPDTNFLGTPIYLVNSLLPLNKFNLKIDFKNAAAYRRIVIVRKVQTPAVVNAFVKKQNEHNEENMLAIKDGTTACGCGTTKH